MLGNYIMGIRRADVEPKIERLITYLDANSAWLQWPAQEHPDDKPSDDDTFWVVIDHCWMGSYEVRLRKGVCAILGLHCDKHGHPYRGTVRETPMRQASLPKTNFRRLT